MHALRWPAGQGLERLGVKAELEHVARLSFGAGQLGIDRFVGTEAGLRMLNPDDKVGDPPHAAEDERHLVDDVAGRSEGITDPPDPRCERLTILSLGDLVDGAVQSAILGQALCLVLPALLNNELGERTEL